MLTLHFIIHNLNQNIYENVFLQGNKNLFFVPVYQ